MSSPLKDCNHIRTALITKRIWCFDCGADILCPTTWSYRATTWKWRMLDE